MSFSTLTFVTNDNEGQEMNMPDIRITASCTLNGHKLTDIPVINPGGWFGKTWLIEMGGSYTPLFLVVEADTIADAIDELSEDETYGHQIHVPGEDLGDYPEDERHHDGSGRAIDLEHVLVHGRVGSGPPFPVKYHAEGEPTGIDPRHFAAWQFN